VGGNTEDMDKKICDDNSKEGDGSSTDEEDADIVISSEDADIVISSEDEDIVTSDSEEEDIGSDGELVCEEGMIEPENMVLFWNIILYNPSIYLCLYYHIWIYYISIP